VLADYKRKHDEFAKAMKKSRETFKVYEGEVKNMNYRVNELQEMKRKMLQGEAAGGKKKKKGGEKDVQDKEKETEKILQEWGQEKENLNKEKEELMEACKQLQDAIRVIKEKSA
jgi:hypothetical protein